MLSKQPININFLKGLDTKTDPYQVQVGNFLSLTNSVFDKVGRLTKRNGFGNLTNLPVTSTSYLTTFNQDLQAIGDNLYSYSANQNMWLNKGSIYPIELSVSPLVRNSTQQTQADSVISSNMLICTAYTESDPSGVSYKYVVSDADTGQNIIGPTIIPASTTYGTPRVYAIGSYFIIIYTAGSGPYSLDYIAVSTSNPNATPLAGTIASVYPPSTTLAFDCIAYNNSIYIAYNGAASSGIEFVSINQNLALTSAKIIDPSHQATMFSVTVDLTMGNVWVSYYDSGTSLGYTTVVTTAGIQILAPTNIISSLTVLNITSTASNGLLRFFYEISNNYSYDSSIPTHYIETNTLTQSGTLGTPHVSIRSLGLASKAFIADNITYYLGTYQSTFQSTYFLIDGSTSTSSNPIVVAKIAYGNGGGYLTTGLPNVSSNNGQYQIPYRFADLLEAQAPSGVQSINLKASPVYTQTGINLVSFNFTTNGVSSVEIGKNLQLTGGFLWAYDGFAPVEQNFFLFPDSIEATWSTSGGSIHAEPDGSTNTNAYYYQVTYEWTDNQGNLFRSAPSIPVAVTTTGNGTSGSITLNVPTLRLTYKVESPISIVIYRWSVANQTYYQVTSITVPKQNSTTIDSVSYVDTLADSSIVGNNIIYTTGGVLEDVNAPSSSIITLFDDRLWLVDAEDPNLLWYSKQVIEATPVEMSDLLTFFVAPSTGAQGSTGNITALCPMDDKLIIFKKEAIYYINGIGPDNTGANNQYSQPIFITGSVGCTNTRSLVIMPSGLMFQSDKGIWLLGRDLSTSYIGAAVEQYNNNTVTSALTIPATNQVRFSLNNNTTLMYDYFVQQWGVFDSKQIVSSTLYNDIHTIVDPFGNVYQETPGLYLDGDFPVLMSFTTSWLNMAGLRGYQRAYWFYFLGTYLSPHKLNVGVAYDYNSSIRQNNIINPNPINLSSLYGQDPYYGGSGSDSFGGPFQSDSNGPSNIEQFRVFLQNQRCNSFQISITEVYDPSYGIAAGAGLTLSGLNCVVGLKKGYSPIPQQQQVG